jgi:anti-sigma B factor antagonist
MDSRDPLIGEPDFRITVTRGGSSDEPALITVAGEVDLATSPDLEETLQRLVEAGCARLVVDFAELTFLDCSGITALMRAARLAREAGATFTVTNPRANVRRVFDIAEMNEFLGVAPAFAAISGKPDLSLGDWLTREGPFFPDPSQLLISG